MILIIQLNTLLKIKKECLRILCVVGAMVFSSTHLVAQEIVFDISKNQPLYLHDDGYASSSLFAKYLDNKFYRLSVNQLPLDVFLKVNNPSILVLTPTIFQFHTDEEVIAVQNYVKKGGNLLIFAEHENFFRSSENSNRFLEGSGMRINYDKAEQTKFNHFAEQFRIRAVNPFVEKDSVIFFFPATLELKDSTFSKAKTEDGQHLAAIAPVGSGKMAVITDFEIIWNMTEKTGFQYGHNDEFISSFINEISNPGMYAEGLTPDGFSKRKSKNIYFNYSCFESDLNKMVNYYPLIKALEKKGYGIIYEETTGSVGPEDIYIGLCACESEAEMDAILQFKRIFLSGYSKTDFWKNITDKFGYFQSGGYDTKHMEEALENLWRYDAYKPISWQDSLEIKLGVLVSRKLSVNDSIFKSNVEIYLQGPGYEYEETFSTGKLRINLIEKGYKFDYVSMHQAKTNEGSYYPAPIENNIMLTTTNVTPYKENAPIIVYKNNVVFSTAPALWRSDFPDKKFQQEAIKAVVEKLTK